MRERDIQRQRERERGRERDKQREKQWRHLGNLHVGLAGEEGAVKFSMNFKSLV